MNVSWDYRASTGARDPSVWIDPALAHGADFADPDRIASLPVPVLGLADADAEILNVSYVPRRELRVVYRLTAPTGQTSVVRVDFVDPATVRSIFARARGRARDPSRVVLLEDWGAVAWRIPEDDRLPVLEALLTPTVAAAALTDAIGAPVAVSATSTRLLSYVPRRRAVVGYAGDGPRAVIAKVGRMRDEGHCHRRRRELFERPDRGFAMPRPLGLDASLGMRVEEMVDGVALEELLVHGDLDRLVDDVAGAMAGVHRTAPLPGLPCIGSADLVAHLDAKTLARLTATLPDLAPRITALADRLRVSQPAPEPAREVMLHGDFHPANLLIGADGPVVIDLDNLAVGPPERDLAVFVGRMILMGLANQEQGDEILAAALALPGRYARVCGREIREDVLDWYLASTMLARQLANAVRRLAPGLPTIAERLLDIADSRLAGAGTRS